MLVKLQVKLSEKAFKPHLMEEAKDLINSFNKSSEPLHLVGELNFIRTESDLVSACLNTLQSTKILIQLIKVLREKELPEKYRHLLMGHLEQTEQLVAKIMAHIGRIFGLEERVCVPAACITVECVKKILVKLIVQLYSFFDSTITEDYLVALVIQVTLLIHLE